MDSASLFPEREDDLDEAAVAAVCARLGRPPAWQDGGHEHSVVGGAVADDRLAWVEKRERDDGGWVDVEYTLHMHAGAARRAWVVDTYNPYFGCTVGALRWCGDEVALVYREKHHTIACMLGLEGPPRMRAIDDAWQLVGDTILHASEARGLVEQIRLPDLAPGPPLPAAVAADHLSAGTASTIDLSAGTAPTLEAMRAALTARMPRMSPTIADLLIGALAYRYWDPWSAPSATYEDVYGNRRWNTPCWLPFYAHHAAPPSEARALLAALDAVAAHSVARPTSAVELARRHLADRCRELAVACRAGRLPEGPSCYFWVEWSQLEFAGAASLFPPGMFAVWQNLRPHAKALAALGEAR